MARVSRKASPETRAYARHKRATANPGEQVVWEMVRGRRMGPRFYRQAVLNGWVVTLYCPSARLAIDIRRAEWVKTARWETRLASLRASGIRHLEIAYDAIFSAPNAVRESIRRAVDDPEFQTYGSAAPG
ncbi:MAG: DUF559 domain-containing protein [Isosphaeraceae bacterium]|nr:DUF559 domain-containing protein [Isosphaeraceae bacterium]